MSAKQHRRVWASLQQAFGSYRPTKIVMMINGRNAQDCVEKTRIFASSQLARPLTRLNKFRLGATRPAPVVADGRAS
jgi:hypothetical protein